MPSLKRAKTRLRSLLREIVASIDDRTLVRAEFERVRVKSLSSLERKRRDFKWNPDDALTNCTDLVGGRVVCNNVEDVYRFEELLRESLSLDSGQIETQDYIKKPTKQGYRALHLNFRLNGGRGLNYELIPCEVQIRSRLQDAWAKLSHPDIYKPENLPTDLCERAADLAEQLAAADRIASGIRARVRQIIDPPKKRPKLDHVSVGGMAFIFKDVFGRGPPDYAVTMAVNLCDDLGIGSLKTLPSILKRQEFRDRLREVYSSIMPVPIAPETVLLGALHALANGERHGVRYVRSQAEEQLREIDSIARQEMLSELPATAANLVEELEDPWHEADIISMAEALGATNKCTVCFTMVVDAYGFAEAAVQHYGDL